MQIVAHRSAMVRSRPRSCYAQVIAEESKGPLVGPLPTAGRDPGKGGLSPSLLRMLTLQLQAGNCRSHVIYAHAMGEMRLRNEDPEMPSGGVCISIPKISTVESSSSHPYDFANTTTVLQRSGPQVYSFTDSIFAAPTSVQGINNLVNIHRRKVVSCKGTLHASEAWTPRSLWEGAPADLQ